MQNEGFKVDYERLPGTSLAPSLSPPTLTRTVRPLLTHAHVLMIQ